MSKSFQKKARAMLLILSYILFKTVTGDLNKEKTEGLLITLQVTSGKSNQHTSNQCSRSPSGQNGMPKAPRV